MGHSAWVCKESDTSEGLSTSFICNPGGSTKLKVMGVEGKRTVLHDAPATGGLPLLLLLLLLSRFSHVRLCATPKAAAHQAPRPWDSPGQHTGVGCHCLLHRWPPLLPKTQPFCRQHFTSQGTIILLRKSSVSKKKKKERKSIVRKSPQAWSFPHFISQQPALCSLARGFTRPSSEPCHKRGIQGPTAPVRRGSCQGRCPRFKK